MLAVTAADRAVAVLLAHLPGKHDQRSHGRSGVAALPRIEGKESMTGAAEATNPSYGTTATDDAPKYREAGRAGQPWTSDMGPLPSGAYEENCTNVTMAFEMRRRGYDVQAAPLDVLDKYGYAAGRTQIQTDQLLADSWRAPGGGPHNRSLMGQKWRSFKDIDKEVGKDWPEGGRGVIFTGKHIFNVVKERGKARYIEAQYDATPNRNVTALYKKKLAGEAKLVRLDDLEPTDAVLGAIVAAGG